MTDNPTANANTDDMAEFASTLGTNNHGEVRSTLRYEDNQSDNTEKASTREIRNNLSAKMWAVHDGKHYTGCDQAVTALPAGQYTVNHSDQGIYFSKTDINMDDIVNIDDAQSAKIMAELETFWTKEEHFRRLGFLWKRGILLWGPPGSGKTVILQTVSKSIVDKDGISIYVKNPSVTSLGLNLLRSIEPKRPIVVMLEDVDAIIQNHGEACLLALMDGELQIDNIAFVATTNYPELLDKRFANRPSRFDTVMKVGMPSVKTRKQFLLAKCPRIHPKELDKWADLTDGFSIAHLKELIISVEVFEIPVEIAAKRLRSMITTRVSSGDSDEKSSFGFNN